METLNMSHYLFLSWCYSSCSSEVCYSEPLCTFLGNNEMERISDLCVCVCALTCASTVHKYERGMFPEARCSSSMQVSFLMSELKQENFWNFSPSP